MAANSAIEWCDATWNPTRGCSRVSAGCDNCYAMRMARRQDRPGGAYEGLTRTGKNGVDWSGVVRLDEGSLTLPLRWRRPRLVFVNSMSDLWHPGVPDEVIVSIFNVMAEARWHTFQILTKRPERAARWCETCMRLRFGRLGAKDEARTLPLPNVWLGTSVEDQAAADERIPWLLKTPAAVRFLSCEPLIGPVDLSRWLTLGFSVCPPNDRSPDTIEALGRMVSLAAKARGWPGLHWVIAGGESGPGARPMHPDWARSLRDQCQAAGVPFFFKQWGAWAPAREGFSNVDADRGLFLGIKGDSRTVGALTWSEGEELLIRYGKKATGRLLDGREWNEMPSPIGALKRGDS